MPSSLASLRGERREDAVLTGAVRMPALAVVITCRVSPANDLGLQPTNLGALAGVGIEDVASFFPRNHYTTLLRFGLKLRLRFVVHSSPLHEFFAARSDTAFLSHTKPHLAQNVNLNAFRPLIQ